MMTIRKLLVLAFLSTVAVSCGDTGQNPGHNGIFLVADIDIAEGKDIEVFCVQNPTDFLVTAKRGTATLANIPVVPEGEDPVPAIQVRSYTVNYISIENGPELTDLTFPMEDTLLIEGGSEAEFEIEVLPIATKLEYFNALDVTTSTNKYTVEYTFSGQNVYGEDVEATGTTNFVVGSFVVPCQ